MEAIANTSFYSTIFRIYGKALHVVQAAEFVARGTLYTVKPVVNLNSKVNITIILLVIPNGQSAKSGLHKSLHDAAFGQFVQVLEYVGWKLGKKIIKVDPKGTSQHCWECLNRVSKSFSQHWHSCPRCGLELDRDYN